MMSRDQTSDGLSQLTEMMSSSDDLFEPVSVERRRTRRRRALLTVAIVMTALLVAVGGYVGWALTAPLGAPVVTSQQPAVSVPAGAAIALPSEGSAAISVSGADAYLGATASGIWAASGGDEPRPIASISKLITALVVLEARPLGGPDDPGPRITFSEADSDLYDKYYVMGATIASMPEGSWMSQRNALATMLIPSASNYAEAVAGWAFGSQSGFVSAARRWLAANGLNGTTIVEPTGISARNTSTPSDLIAIGKLAAANPTIAQIVATPSLSLPGPGRMNTTNDLLGVGGITGLKTGNLGEGSYNLLYTATLDVGAGAPLSVTGVMLGGYSRETLNGDVLALLDSIRNGFHQLPVATAGQEIGTFSTPWGSSATMIVGESASIFTWSDTPITTTMDMTTPTEYDDGEVVGSITWTAGPNTATVPIQIQGSIEPPTEWWRLTHPGELGGE